MGKGGSSGHKKLRLANQVASIKTRSEEDEGNLESSREAHQKKGKGLVVPNKGTNVIPSSLTLTTSLILVSVPVERSFGVV